MKVGTLQETIVVTGETPIVDVQSARRETVVSKDLIAGLPTTGGYSSLLALVPGIVGGTRDVQTGPCACTFSSHGAMLAGRANEEGRTLLDGLLISVPQGSSSNYLADTRNASELSFTVAGSLGETETGGPVLNIVPQTGGNKCLEQPVRGRRSAVAPGQQLHAGTEGRRAHGRHAAHEELRLQRRARRSHSPRTACGSF